MNCNQSLYCCTQPLVQLSAFQPKTYASTYRRTYILTNAPLLDRARAAGHQTCVESLQQSPVMDQLRKDEEVLRELGYKQVLYRTWGTFTTVTIAISAMSVLTSVSGELTHGYPVGPNAPVTLA